MRFSKKERRIIAKALNNEYITKDDIIAEYGDYRTIDHKIRRFEVLGLISQDRKISGHFIMSEKQRRLATKLLHEDTKK